MKREISSIIRLKSLIIDLLIVFILSMPFILVMFIFNLNNMVYQAFVLSILYSNFLCKDIIQNRSIGKRKCNLIIVDIDHNKISPLKLIMRNVFIVVWPLELLLYLVYPERRIGDIVCGTKVIKSESRITKLIITKNNILTFFIVLLLSFSLFYFLVNILFDSSKIVKLLYS